MNHLCLVIQKISNEMSLEMLSIKNKELIQLGNTYSTYSELISEYGLRIVENLRLDD